MTETIPVRVQHKRMSASEWTNSPLVLLDGELGVESDTGKVKVGNGRDLFPALLYLAGQKGDKGERGEAGPRGVDGMPGLKGAVGPRGADGTPGQNIINQNGGLPLKYWAGTKSEYDAIANKDENTIYDIYTA